jgi:hypothetical protein
LSTYAEEEDIEEDSSSLIKRTNKAEAINKFMEISSGLQSEVVSEFTEKDMGVEDPKEAVARKQAEDRVQVKKLSEDLQGKDVVDSLSLVLKDSDALITKVSEDVIPTSFHQTCVNFNDPEITITFENPDHLSSASVNDSEAMENVITATQTQTQTFINPPPTIDTDMILSSVCIEIFESLMELVETRRNDIQLFNYSYKWSQLKKLIDSTLDSLQEIVVASQQEVLKEWFP